MTRPRYFGGVMSAMVTPFDAQGRLDLDAAQRLARWLADPTATTAWSWRPPPVKRPR
jgi:hypothetical protein